MKRILFVDDEPRVLAGLKRLLHKMRGEWEMEFAESGAEALDRLATAPFDVLVTDMRMPKMDGAALLTHARDRYPKTVRIILSGHTEDEAAYRALPIAHQFLAKPCDADMLRQTIDRSSKLLDTISNDRVLSAVGRIGRVPSIPRLYRELTAVLASSTSSNEQIADVLEQDPGMCGKLLQMVNSAFFGQPRRVSDVSQAVALLGTQMLRNLVLNTEVFDVFPARSDTFSIDKLQRHIALTARIAAQLEPRAPWAQEAYTAGLLHDIGILVIASYLPDDFKEIVERSDRESTSMHVIEADVIGVTHAEIGGYLLGLWGLQHSTVEAVAYHHTPEQLRNRSFDCAQAVYVANELAHDCDASGDAAHKRAPAALSYIDLDDRYEEWQPIGERFAAQLENAED